ncbi:MAG TPA: CmpA/NrtA family ABC transporter substrate-binding protein [Gammaproteobacteria bacterium]
MSAGGHGLDTVVAAFVPLVDAAVLVAARELGFAQEHGIELRLVKEPSWASLRDHLNLGHVDCAHALAPLPIAAALGIGQVRSVHAVPFVLGRGGNAITVSNALADELRDADGELRLDSPARTAQALAAAARRRGGELTLAMVYPFSGHNFELRYWLASAGLDPDRDVRLVTIPPPLMVESLRAGHIDGFCVGEPWNSVAVEERIGAIAAVKSKLLPFGIEKVLAMRTALAADADATDRLLRSLRAAARWCDTPANRPELAALLARPEYLGVPAHVIGRSLGGVLDVGGGATFEDGEFLVFARRDASAPRPEEALWLYAQMVRWGQTRLDRRLAAAAEAVFRPDLYERAVGAPAAAGGVEAFDGARFDADRLGEYLAQFPVRAGGAGFTDRS